MNACGILLVEDEAALLGLLKRHLERSGYAVVACVSAEVALEALVESPSWAPTLLVSDETLPGLSGMTLAVRLLERFPQMVSILCSGYPLTLDGVPESLRSRAMILQKPFMPAMLDLAIAEILAKRPEARAQSAG